MQVRHVGEMATGFDNDERVLAGDEWKVEARAVMKDVMDHVFEISLSEEAGGCSGAQDQVVYMNLTTKEMRRYCIELTAQGFRVAGEDYNRTDGTSDKYYETPYALLDNISPLYRQAFGDSLTARLNELGDSFSATPDS